MDVPQRPFPRQCPRLSYVPGGMRPSGKSERAFAVKRQPRRHRRENCVSNCIICHRHLSSALPASGDAAATIAQGDRPLTNRRAPDVVGRLSAASINGDDMRYAPWLPPAESDRAFYEEFRAIGHAFHDGTLRRDVLEAWRERQLKAVLAHVTTSSPFYKNHFSGIDLGRVRPQDLSTLPFTTKADLRDQMLGMVSGDVRDAMYYYQTTGTTGPATPCPRGIRESVASNFNVAMSLKKILTKVCGAEAKPIVAVLVPNELHSACKTIADVCKDLGILVLDAWPGSPVMSGRACVDVLARLQVDAVIGPPAVFPSLAKAATKYGLKPESDFGLKAILCLGEICSAPMKRNIASIWNCAIFDFIYGAQEAFVMAAADRDGLLVPSLPNYVWEIIDPATGQSSPSGYGELCVTCLVDGVKPLLRYKTGDVVDLSFDAMRPAAATSRLRVFGRTRDKIRVADAEITALELEELALEGATSCVGYQYLLLEDAAGPAVR